MPFQCKYPFKTSVRGGQLLSSYEDTKKIIQNESIKAGISKHGNGKRSWLALVCDGSPLRLFLSLFNVLFFRKICKLPCGELKKHIDEIHWGKTDSVLMKFDHILPSVVRTT